MAVPMKTIIDCSTGVVSEIPLTDEEMAQREIDAQNAAKAQAERDAEIAAKEAAKASAIAKLSALGLSADEIAALN